ncbi:dnaJ homolog subfamily C member 7-like [Teleopsis dalmanni]|uniref:dnaJ homolog subfamily C member 7-like n=1 Tax=Teleopsis dalmanni TaxID=139649 RepID=UPI0018CEBBAC|nr:dnaJ homolog subfamily C member 7-like [Teleopsis dalmanni]
MEYKYPSPTNQMNFDNIDASAADIKRRLGNDELLAKRYESALRCFDEAILICPTDPTLYLSRSGAFMMLSNYKAALSDALTAVYFNSKLKSAYVRVINISIALGNIGTATAAIEKLAALDPYSEALNVGRILIANLNKLEREMVKHYYLQSFEDIVYLCNQVLSIAPANLKYKLRKCEALLHLTKINEAVDILDKLILSEDEAQHPYLIYVLGLRYFYEDKIDRAKQYFSEAIDLNLESNNILEIHRDCCRIISAVQQGYKLIEERQYIEAYDIYSQIIDELRLGPITKCRFLCLRAYLAWTTKKIERAIDDCSLVLNIDNTHLDALLLRAECFDTLEKYKESIDDYEAAYKLDGSWQNWKKLCTAKGFLAQSKIPTFYDILNVHQSATYSEIKSAYKRHAMDHHPDRHPHASSKQLKREEDKFKKIQKAYETLSDEVDRMEYDEYIKRRKINESHSS